jgi:hypothetical protein
MMRMLMMGMLMMAQMNECFASADRPAGRTACRPGDRCG